MSETKWATRIRRDDVIDIASKLIAIPSPSGEERAVMEWVSGWCEQNELSSRIFANDPDRPNVVVTVGDPGSGPTIAMNGHLDTVPVSDADSWVTPPYEPAISDDGKMLAGRGSSDMKSATGVMLYTTRLFRDFELTGCVQAHIVSDEEVGGHYGARHLLAEIEAGRLVRPDYCLIGEKSDLKVRNAERGMLAVEIIFRGRASHTAAARATGINAIAKAAKGVLALEQDIDRFHPAVGKPVISINGIEAGIAHNVVPGECTIDVDRRLVPGETDESALAEMRAALDAVAAADPDFQYEIIRRDSGGYSPANITDEDSPIVATMQDAIRDVTGQEPEFFVAWAGGTDGRFYRFAGIDTVGYGPGGQNAHGANEAVFVDDLVTHAEVYAETIGRMLDAR